MPLPTVTVGRGPAVGVGAGAGAGASSFGTGSAGGDWRSGQYGDATPAQAATNALVPRYPTAIDSPPTIVNDQTPLSAQYDNYLGMLIESIEAELGAIGDPVTGLIGGQSTLLDFFGTEASPRLSVVVGNDAGKIFGFQVIERNQTGAYWGTTSFPTETYNTPHGQATANPTAFCSPVFGFIGNTEAQTAPMVPRMRATWATATSVLFEFRACESAAYSVPRYAGSTNANTYKIYFTIFYPLQ